MAAWHKISFLISALPSLYDFTLSLKSAIPSFIHSYSIFSPTKTHIIITPQNCFLASFPFLIPRTFFLFLS